MPTRNRISVKLVLGALAFASVSACVPTVEGYQALLESYQGASERQLVARWGAPDRSYRSGGSTYLTYSESRSGYVPGIQPTYHTDIIGNTAYTTAIGGSPGFAYTETCETTFEIRGGRVVGYTFKGDGCTALPPEPS